MPLDSENINQITKIVAAVGGGAAFSKPATALLEKLSTVLGIITAPWQMKRNYRAEAANQILKAKTEIEVGDLQHRAELRRKVQVLQEQATIEEVVSIGVANLTDEAKPADIDTDWLATFFDKCRLVSNEQMQMIWGQVLAGEANRPGSFSSRTLSFLATLTKEEALAFRNLCSYNWLVDEKHTSIIMSDHSVANDKGVILDKMASPRELLVPDLQHLASIGLIIEFAGFNDAQYNSKTMIASYHGIKYRIESVEKHQSGVRIGAIFLSKIGQELAAICQPEYDEEILMFTLKSWMRWGYIITCPLCQQLPTAAK